MFTLITAVAWIFFLNSLVKAYINTKSMSDKDDNSESEDNVFKIDGCIIVISLTSAMIFDLILVYLIFG